ncbi:ComEC family competence protein [compost metagenome]
MHVVIATHGDQDHIGGLQAVLDHFPVDALLINGSLADSETMTKLMQTAITKHIPIYAPYKGMKLQPDEDTLLQFISPQSNVSEGGVPLMKEQNHWSVVFLLKMSGASFLFTGDMDESAELSVLANEKLSKGGDIASVDVMKVAHHGSKTSTSAEWIHRWKPPVSVISVGSSNTYGHPNASVLERLEQAGSTVYRSDLHGEVQMQIIEGRILVRYRNP